MNSLKLLSRLPAARFAIQPALTRSISLTGQRNRYGSGWRNPFEDSLLSLGSNLMRSMERDLDQAVRQVNRFMPTQFYLPGISGQKSRTGSGNNELITTDEAGNRKFSLPLDLSDFEPEEIKIKTDQDHNMTITAKKEKSVIFCLLF
jgi:hypothetical protein